MKKYLPIAAAILALSAGPSFAFGFHSGTSGSADHGQMFMTPRGPVMTTGRMGRVQTTTLPGSGGQGMLVNNGNGTSTLLVPGGAPETLATPN